MISPRFVKFCAVGAAGFLADTAALLVLVHFGGAPPLLAKGLSFGVAVCLTFECNRRWAFAAHRGAWLPTFTAYLGVQAGGFMVNWAVFALALGVLPGWPGRLFAAAAIASAGGLVINFLGARGLVFRGSSTLNH